MELEKQKKTANVSKATHESFAVSKAQGTKLMHVTLVQLGTASGAVVADLTSGLKVNCVLRSEGIGVCAHRGFSDHHRQLNYWSSGASFALNFKRLNLLHKKCECSDKLAF